jgi:hypothetical protein
VPEVPGVQRIREGSLEPVPRLWDTEAVSAYDPNDWRPDAPWGFIVFVLVVGLVWLAVAIPFR